MSEIAAHLPNRMTDPVVRRRVAAFLIGLTAITWTAVGIAGRPSGPFSQGELRDLSGVPVPPPQIQGRYAPPSDPQADLARQIQQLQQQFPQPPAALGGGK